MIHLDGSFCGGGGTDDNDDRVEGKWRLDSSSSGQELDSTRTSIINGSIRL